MRWIPLCCALMLLGCDASDGSSTADTAADTTSTTPADTITSPGDTQTPEDTQDTASPDTAPPDTVDANDTTPVDTTPSDTTPADTTPVDTALTDTVPVDTAPPVDPLAGAVAPTVGDLVFSELMVDPLAVSDTRGEWVELLSLSDGPLDLAGCELIDGRGQRAALATVTDSRMAAMSRVVIASTADPALNGGVVPQLLVPGFLWSNSLATAGLSCDGALIDQVHYDKADWPLIEGRALALSAAGAPTANDDPERWCPATAPYGAGDRGTPGEPNGVCPPRDVEVDACELIAPTTVTIFEDAAHILRADLRDAGNTDLTSGIDAIYFLAAEAGIGPVGSDPSQDDSGWQWQPATPVAGWDDAASPGADRYEITLDGLAFGTYRTAFRFSMDRGQTWRYCDADDGDSTFVAADMGQLTVADSPCIPNPCVTAPAPSCEGDLLTTPRDGGTCRVDEGGGAACAFVEDRTDCALLAGHCDAGGCVDVAETPGVGELVITEIMKDPVAVFDAYGEWIELESVVDDVRTLVGCVLEDRTGDMHVITPSAPLLVAPRARILIGRTEDPALNGGLSVDYAVTSGFSLNNASADLVVLRCGDTVVDEVAFDPTTFPDDAGAAMQLDPRSLDAASNDAGAAWCSARAPFPDAQGTDFGTPGAPNERCPTAPLACRLMPPARYDVLDGDVFEVRGRLGVPDLGADDNVTVQVGVGPAGSLPDDGWTYTDAALDAGWDGDEEPGLAQYDANVTAPDAAGDWAVALRVTVDSGLSWHLCDLDTGEVGEDGIEDGFQLHNAALLVVTEHSACHPNPCMQSPPDVCLDDVLTRYEAFGSCTLTGAAMDQATCDFASATLDCGALGGRCEGLACVDLAMQPGDGDVVVTEVMNHPTRVSDFFGEWVELDNVSGVTVNLDGCELGDDDGESHAIRPLGGALLIEPGERVVLARHADSARNGGVTPDYVYGDGMTLGNTDDEVVLTCDGVVVDRVAYGRPDDGFPAEAGASKQLDSGSISAAVNDDGAVWCASSATYGAGDRGTPGEPNGTCL